MRISILLFGVVASSYMLVEYHPGKATFFGAAAVLFLHILRLGEAAWMRHNHYHRDTAMISKRICPECNSGRTLEVTSDQMETGPDGRQFRCVVLACNNCDESCIVEMTNNGVAARRLGKLED